MDGWMDARMDVFCTHIGGQQRVKTGSPFVYCGLVDVCVCVCVCVCACVRPCVRACGSQLQAHQANGTTTARALRRSSGSGRTMDWSLDATIRQSRSCRASRGRPASFSECCSFARSLAPAINTIQSLPPGCLHSVTDCTAAATHRQTLRPSVRPPAMRFPADHTLARSVHTYH